MSVIFDQVEAPTRQHNTTRSPIPAMLGWGISVSLCAGVVAFITLAVAHYSWATSLTPRVVRYVSASTPFTIVALGILGLCLGVSAGLFVGPRRVQKAIALGLCGLVAGVAGADVCLLTLDLTDTGIALSLKFSGAWAAAGFLTGVFARAVSSWGAVEREKAAEISDHDIDESAAPAVKVEWLLREPKRPWRVSRPLLRVLPVVAVAVGALVWGAVAANAALCAVAALGAVVAHALFRQEKRLDELERRSISERDTRPSV